MRLIYEKMATDDITECMFTVGSIVSCVTCFDHNIEGEVIAFDYTKRVLILKSNSSDGKTNTNDVNCLNLDYVKDVSVKREVKREEVVNTMLPQINTSKVEERYHRAVEERRQLTEAFNAGISSDGIKLWMTLNKSLRDLGVVWEDDNIVIDKSIRIEPPFKADNCVSFKNRGSPDGSVKQIRKLVDKFWSDQKNVGNANKGGAAQPVAKSPNNVQPTDKPPFNNKG